MRKSSKLLAVSAMLLSLGLGCGRHTEAPHSETPKPEQSEVRISPTPALAMAQDASIADIAAKALPSVVNVSSTRTRKVQSPLGHFFGGGPQERRQEGLGSGVIIDGGGLVVTNNHVVEDADEIQVTTNDKREFTAKVVGTDPKSDVAVLKLEGDTSGLVPLAIGNSGDLRLGDVVLAIGNPFGVGQTVTMGIVSAKGRANMGIVDYEDFIQTDAAINPGNSGGALVNMRGELVGINTAILSRSGGSQGIGFAIPTNMAKPIVEALTKDGRVSRGWLGVAIQEVDSEIAHAMKLPKSGGVLIADVQADSPGKRAGLERGDVVTHVGDVAVDSPGGFRNLVASAGAEHVVKLAVVRKGKGLTLNAKLGELPGQEKGPPAAKQGGSLDGLSVAPLDAEVRKQLGITGEPRQGVVLSKVVAGSAADRAGLKPGDVILEVNRTEVKTPADFERLYTGTQGTRLLLVYRGGATQFVVVK
jgi:serine protease Do